MSAPSASSGETGQLRQRPKSENTGVNHTTSHDGNERDNHAAESKARKTFGRTPDGTGKYDGMA